MCRPMFSAPVARPSPNSKAAYKNNNTSFVVNNAQKQHAALKHKSLKEKEHEHEWTDEELRAVFLGPWSMYCMEVALFKVQHDWVMKVLEERKSRGNASGFGKHYLGLPGRDKIEYPRKPSGWGNEKKSKSAPLATEAQATKPVLADPITILKPVEPAADSSAVQTLAAPTTSKAAGQQSETKQANTQSAAAPTTSGSDSQMDTIATKDNSSSVTVLPSPKTSTQETTAIEGTTPNAFVSKFKSWFKNLMAFELEVTISF